MFVALLPAGCNYRFASDWKEKWKPPRVSLRRLTPDYKRECLPCSLSFFFSSTFIFREKKRRQVEEEGKKSVKIFLNFKRDFTFDIVARHQSLIIEAASKVKSQPRGRKNQTLFVHVAFAVNHGR